MITIIGLDAGDDDRNQAEDHQGKDEKKADNDKAQRQAEQRVDHQGDLKVEGLFGLLDHKVGIVFF